MPLCHTVCLVVERPQRTRALGAEPLLSADSLCLGLGPCHPGFHCRCRWRCTGRPRGTAAARSNPSSGRKRSRPTGPGLRCCLCCLLLGPVHNRGCSARCQLAKKRSAGERLARPLQKPWLRGRLVCLICSELLVISLCDARRNVIARPCDGRRSWVYGWRGGRSRPANPRPGNTADRACNNSSYGCWQDRLNESLKEPRLLRLLRFSLVLYGRLRLEGVSCDGACAKPCHRRILLHLPLKLIPLLSAHAL